MAKKRIHEIAKEQGIPSKDLLDTLQPRRASACEAADSVHTPCVQRVVPLALVLEHDCAIADY